jgi:hypothetical protein
VWAATGFQKTEAKESDPQQAEKRQDGPGVKQPRKNKGALLDEWSAD